MPDGRQIGFLSDIVESARLIQSYVAGIGEQEYFANAMLQDAVIRRFEIIGEASARLADETRALFARIPWRLIVAMRNRLIHEYDNIHTDIIWETIHTDLPGLIAAIGPWLEEQQRIGENF